MMNKNRIMNSSVPASFVFKNKISKKIGAALVCCVGFFFAGPGYAISIQELNQKIENKEDLTIIDIRINVLYQNGHIHNAINIPASIMEHKKLPPLGKVIVYGDGIDDEDTENAVNYLNEKPGIQAEILDGGFSAWSAKHAMVQRHKGLSASKVKNIDYKKLQKMALKRKRLILVDLRMDSEQELLSEHFPNIKVVDPIKSTVNNKKKGKVNARISRAILSSLPKRNRNVLILIDDGNGFSEKVADKLHAAGTKRVAILSGGEQALRARGEITTEVRNK